MRAVWLNCPWNMPFVLFLLWTLQLVRRTNWATLKDLLQLFFVLFWCAMWNRSVCVQRKLTPKTHTHTIKSITAKSQTRLEWNGLRKVATHANDIMKESNIFISNIKCKGIFLLYIFSNLFTYCRHLNHDYFFCFLSVLTEKGTHKNDRTVHI